MLIVSAASLESATADDLLLPAPDERLVQDCDRCPVVVALPDGLMISQTPVTRGEFRAFVEASGWAKSGWGCNWSFAHFEQTDDHPVVCVTYQDAEAYIAWLSEISGESYRLPTRDEMRYAALGGSGSNYWWGQAVGDKRANCTGCGGSAQGTVPVGSFGKNLFNVADAVGNVWIWTSDCANEACSERYLLGGAWSSSPADLRMGEGIWSPVDLPFNTYGIRVVREETH